MPSSPPDPPRVTVGEPPAVSGERVGVGRRMAKGAAWMIFMRFGIRGIGLVSTIILARLLLPADFGVVALATMLLAALDVMSAFSFDVVLIQNQNAGRRHYDTGWTLSVIRNSVMAAVLVLLAGPFATIFDEPRLQGVTYFLALAAFLEGFQNIGVVDFRKELQFHKEFLFMVGAKLGMFVVAVPLAFVWRNYWALVAGIVAAAVCRLVLGYVMHPYRPRLDLAKWREIMHFSKWLLLNNILYFVRLRSDTFVIGKIVGAEALGFYTIAHEVSNLATSELVAPIRRAIFPGYAKLASEPDLLRRNFIDTLALILMVAVPVAAGIGLTADPLVRVVLGERWLDSIGLIKILAVYGLIEVCSANSGPAYLALGRPAVLTALVGVAVAVQLPLLVWGVAAFGTYGAAWAVTASATAFFVANTAVAIRLLRLRAGDLFRALWRTAVAVAVMAGGVALIQAAWRPAPTFGPQLALLAACVATGAVLYIGTHGALWRLAGLCAGPERHVVDAFKRGFLRLRPGEAGGGAAS